MNKNDVISIKLTTGEEAIGRFDSETDGTITLNRPMSFVAGPQGLGLGPFMFSLSKNSVVTVNKSTIIATVKTDELIMKEYIKQTSGLVV
jgi:hypothetical protein